MNEELNLCPACINDFINSAGTNNLGTEPRDLRITNNSNPSYCTKRLCEDHKERNQFEELRKALDATKHLINHET